MNNGDSQPATLAAAPPASPSRASTPAVVHVGAAPATASRAAPRPLSFSLTPFIVPPRPRPPALPGDALSCRLRLLFAGTLRGKRLRSRCALPPRGGASQAVRPQAEPGDEGSHPPLAPGARALRGRFLGLHQVE